MADHRADAAIMSAKGTLSEESIANGSSLSKYRILPAAAGKPANRDLPLRRQSSLVNDPGCFRKINSSLAFSSQDLFPGRSGL